MKKITKLRICDWTLLFLFIAILVSSICLEAHLLFSTQAVWIHISIGSLFIGFIIWHINLHWAILKNAFKSRTNKKGRPLNLLMILFLILTAISALIATAHWLTSFAHSPIGGVHGKLGFIFLILLCIHIYKKRLFYK